VISFWFVGLYLYMSVFRDVAISFVISLYVRE